jgi:hypothetical protein
VHEGQLLDRTEEGIMSEVMSEADRRELERLQDPEHWDWDSAESHPGNPIPGIVLRVRFQGDDARLVLAAAKAARTGAIEYVRQAAIQAAKTRAE